MNDRISQLFNAYEKALSSPDDPEPVRNQKRLTLMFSITGVVLTTLVSILFFATDLDTLGWIHLFYALFLAATIPLVIFRNRLFNWNAIGFGVIAVATNFSGHALSGGYQGGMWFLAYLIMLPLNLLLASGFRIGMFAFILSVAAYLVAAFLEPVFATSTLVIPPFVRVFYNTVLLVRVTAITFIWSFYFVRQSDEARAQADRLLLNILPAPIAGRLKRDTSTIADGFDEVTVLFADIVNFTALSADANPVDVVSFLNEVFSDFDDLATTHGLEKIKTIGDAYMVAGGLPVPRPDHCEAVVAFGLDMLAAVKRHTAWHGEPVRLRVGVNTGPAVAGVIGRRKFIYDLWGDAVNTASRMESNGVADVIQVTAAVKEKLAGRYEFEERPPMVIKGKGEMITYLLRAPAKLPTAPLG